MRFKIKSLVLLILLFLSCSKENDKSNEAKILEFGFVKQYNNELSKDITQSVNADKIKIDFSSENINIRKLKAQFKISKNAKLKIGDIDQISNSSENNFISDLTYTVIAEDGTKKDYVISINTIIKERYDVKHDGATMPIWVEGKTDKRTVLIFVHGGPGGNAHTTNYTKIFSKKVEDNNLVCYWDQRGTIMSKGGDDASKLTIAKNVEDLEKVVDSINKFYPNYKVFLLGESWGGLLVPSYLIKGDNQKNIQGWIQVVGSHNIPLSRKLSVDMIERIGNEEKAKNNNEKWWEDKIKEVKKIDLNKVDDKQLIKKLYDAGGECEKKISDISPREDQLINKADHGTLHQKPEEIEFSPNVFQSMVLELVKASVSNDLSKVTIPTIILYGKYDFLVPPGLADDVVKNIGSKSVKKVEFTKSGHGLMTTETTKAITNILDFINTNI